MAAIYYIDSENVGDSWIELLNMSENTEDMFYIFYTSHTQRIGYEHIDNLIRARERLKFIKCYEGNNGLDFQLVSYLGYELNVDNSKEMIIVSKDTGFDSVVYFWSDRGMNIKRLSITKGIADAGNDSEMEQIKLISNMPSKIDYQELYTIINCVGTIVPANIHLVFVHFYGGEGKSIYKIMKKEKFIVPSVNWSKEIRMKKLISLIINYSNKDDLIYPETISDFIVSNIVDNKTVMLNVIKMRYGEQGARLHKVFKPFYKTLSQIKNA